MAIPKIDQRMNMLFCFKLGKSAKETHEMLTTIYEGRAVILKFVYEWFKCFQEGRDNVEDAPRTGWPATAHSPDNVQKVKELLSQDCRVTVR